MGEGDLVEAEEIGAVVKNIWGETVIGELMSSLVNMIMNKLTSESYLHYLPLAIAGIYVVVIYLYPGLLVFSGFFAIAILLSALQKWGTQKILVLLSPIASYPLFLYFTRAFTDRNDILHLPFHWLQNLTIYIAIYALLNGLAFIHLWSWLAANKRRLTILGLAILAATTLFYGSLSAECHLTSNAEKGVTQGEISRCKFLNLYNPTGASLSGTFSGFAFAAIKIPSQGVGYASIVIILTLLYFEMKYQPKPRNVGPDSLDETTITK